MPEAVTRFLKFFLNLLLLSAAYTLQKLSNLQTLTH